jgi:hypothetical protein
MRLGFVVECFRDGADHKVLEQVVLRMRPELTKDDLRWSCMRKKRFLLDDCGAAVEALFNADKCDRVFVVWDLMPCDKEMQEKGKPSCKLERVHVLSKVDPKHHARTVLICIRHELEAWLLCDGQALSDFLEKKPHPKPRIADDKTPDRHPNPKVVLGKIFNEHGHGREYRDTEHAPRLIEKVKSLSKLQKSQSFKRLCEKLDSL